MSTTIRAKFECTKNTADGSGNEVEFWPVTQGSPEENKRFWEATPSGRLEMFITNPDAANFFQVGQAYYLDFTKADATS